MGTDRSKWIFLAGIVLAVGVLDQATKALIAAWLPQNGSVTIIPGFFNLVHVKNPGGAFGFLSGQYSDVKRLFFLAGTLVAAGMLLHLFRKLPGGFPVLRAGVALILGGAAGNFMDRVRCGEVLDFLDFYWKEFHWPAFNVADSAVTVGAGIFLFHLLFRKIPD